MNIVIAVDSFKGSLSSLQAGDIIVQAAQTIFPRAAIQRFPVADGGEGTVDALAKGLGGKIIAATVTGPLGEKIASRYGILPQTNRAIIEMADAAGLPLVPPEKRNPLHTTTYGLGELILQAAQAGCREFIIGIGGSATNDCGLGMLTALGARFFRADGSRAGITGGDLETIESIDVRQLAPVLQQCRFHIACDVTNPLYGPQGCSAIFAPQKGASAETVQRMDQAIRSFAQKAAVQLGYEGAQLPGAGAAGGLGYAFHAFLQASLEPGISLILKATGLEAALGQADLVITGEGRLDAQTAMGKAPIGIARLAKGERPKTKVIALCGCARPEARCLNEQGIDAYFPILPGPMSLQEAMDPGIAAQNLRQTAEQVLRLLRTV